MLIYQSKILTMEDFPLLADAALIITLKALAVLPFFPITYPKSSSATLSL